MTMVQFILITPVGGFALNLAISIEHLQFMNCFMLETITIK
jgi:hypothetical protein